VRTLVDVRRLPWSRRHPQFSQRALAERLAAAGIAYRHEPDLGGHREPRPDSPNAGLRAAALRGYADHMATPGFRAALERLAAAEPPAAFLCAEADWRRCHRQLIADALLARGIGVRHLLAPGRDEPHRLTPGAHVTPERGVAYPGRGRGRAAAGLLLD
jgi:uncharacterized protein (DUF488 family)